MKKLTIGCALTVLLLPEVSLADESGAYGERGATEEAEQPIDDAYVSHPEEKKHHHFIIGVDGHLIGAVRGGNGEAGGGFDGRFGWHNAALGIFAFRPEFGLGYVGVPGEDVGRAYGGVRLGLQALVGVYGYGHAGYAWGGSADGFTYDAGLAVDLLLWFFRPGLHVDYMGVVDGMKALRGGLHVELAF
jgi:hypothetical protein